MTAYDPSQWSDLFVATAGASAALPAILGSGIAGLPTALHTFDGAHLSWLAGAVANAWVLLVEILR